VRREKTGGVGRGVGWGMRGKKGRMKGEVRSGNELRGGQEKGEKEAKTGGVESGKGKAGERWVGGKGVKIGLKAGLGPTKRNVKEADEGRGAA